MLEEPGPEKEVEVLMARKYPTCVSRGAKRLGISKAKAQKSYNRGIGAWKSNYTGPRRGGRKLISKEGWACGRVNKLRRGGNYDQDLL